MALDYSPPALFILTPSLCFISLNNIDITCLTKTLFDISPEKCSTSMASPNFSVMLSSSCSYMPRCGLSLRVLLTRYSRGTWGVRKSLLLPSERATKVMKTKLIRIILLADVTFRAQCEAVCISWRNFRQAITWQTLWFHHIERTKTSCEAMMQKKNDDKRK